jgi:cobalt/nickel transport protein
MSAMNSPAKPFGSEGNNPRFFDGFTKVMLATMIVIELAIFASGSYMSHHKLTGIGTDDVVNNLATATKVNGEHHPFVQLPGDAELSAFSVANFFAGIIVGYNWLRLFGSMPQSSTKKTPDN